MRLSHFDTVPFPLCFHCTMYTSPLFTPPLQPYISHFKIENLRGDARLKRTDSNPLPRFLYFSLKFNDIHFSTGKSTGREFRDAPARRSNVCAARTSGRDLTSPRCCRCALFPPAPPAAVSKFVRGSSRDVGQRARAFADGSEVPAGLRAPEGRTG